MAYEAHPPHVHLEVGKQQSTAFGIVHNGANDFREIELFRDVQLHTPTVNITLVQVPVSEGVLV